MTPFSIVENLGVNPDSGGLPLRRGSGAQVVRREVGSGKGAGPRPTAASVLPDVPLAASTGTPFHGPPSGEKEPSGPLERRSRHHRASTARVWGDGGWKGGGWRRGRAWPCILWPPLSQWVLCVEAGQHGPGQRDGDIRAGLSGHWAGEGVGLQAPDGAWGPQGTSRLRFVCEPFI